jgi:hypothetical protein
MEKVSFALDVEDGWPPVAVQHMWCEKRGSAYELKSAPFFLHGLAVGDKFTAEPDSVNGCVFEFSVIETSGHSLVWVIERENLQLEKYKQELFEIGCNLERFAQFKLHSIDVPASANPEAVCIVMDKLEDLGFNLAYPVWRHEHESA